jgi:hypothetical protein
MEQKSVNVNDAIWNATRDATWDATVNATWNALSK